MDFQILLPVMLSAVLQLCHASPVPGPPLGPPLVPSASCGQSEPWCDHFCFPILAISRVHAGHGTETIRRLAESAQLLSRLEWGQLATFPVPEGSLHELFWLPLPSREVLASVLIHSTPYHHRT